MFHNLELERDAIFIADAHYPNHGKKFLTFLQNIRSGKVKTRQLILMGDIFDLLIGTSSYLKDRFKTEIALIDTIAQNMEVIYIEGNHDFYLKNLFKNVKIIPIEKQPLIMYSQNRTIAISHGDKYCMKLSYKIYTKLIRKPLVLKLIPQIYAKNKLLSMKNKKICKKIKNFKTKAKYIAKNYNVNLIIEGHHHQGAIVDNYISLPSFACSGEVGLFNGNKVEFVSIAL